MTKTSSKAKVGDTIASISTETLNERILRQCHEFYTDPEKGLVEIGKRVDLSLLAPRKKIIVLLIGNHSAGKSSYINWYIEEHILKTGVAMETQGVTFVTSGKKRETFSGNATLHLYSHFEPLREINGVVDYLSTEVSTSKQKKFSLVTFIDTPGLVDGNMKYPFDINEAILWLGECVIYLNLIGPCDFLGQVVQSDIKSHSFWALCKRTLDLVEELAIKNGDRMKFYLSKADEAGNEADRQRVMMQIVQEICKKPLLNKTSFDMPTIYIPNPNVKVRCLNQIEETSKEIERTINHTIQNTLNTLEDDCKKIATKIDTMLIEDQIRRETNWSIWVSSSVMFMISLALPLLVFMCLTSSFLVGGQLAPFLPKDMLHAVEPYAEPFSSLWSAMKLSFRNFLIIIFGSIFLFFFSKFYSRRHTQPTMTKKQKQQLLENKNYVIDYIKGKKDSMYKEYLRDYIADNEM